MARVLILAILLAVAPGASSASALPREAQLSADNNAFAVDLYSHLSSAPGNLFFSPYSISSAFACAYAGARGDTAAQMRKALHFTLPDLDLHVAFKWESDSLNAGGTKDGKVPYQMSVANALWGLQGYPYNPDFLKLLADDYGTGFQQIDFAHSPDQARANINRWVEDMTSNKIKDLIAPKMIDPYTRLVLVNAIYFKASWDSHFDERETEDQPFHLDDQQTVTAALMHEHRSLNGLDDPDLQAVGLPYVGHRLEMVVVLPKSVTGLHALEGRADIQDITRRLSKTSRPVDVYLPRFKLDGAFNLHDVLSSMGIPDAFSTAADFSGITAAEPLHLTFAVHKAYVSVNEEGTEAAAATGWGGGLTGGGGNASPMVFRADHPFIFLIRDSTTGAILFMGRVMDPTK